MSAEARVGAAADLPPGTMIGVGHYAVGNVGGQYFAVTRRCRHLGADLAGGRIDDAGCLVCPWHQSAYDVNSGPPAGATPWPYARHAHVEAVTEDEGPSRQGDQVIARVHGGPSPGG